MCCIKHQLNIDILFMIENSSTVLSMMQLFLDIVKNGSATIVMQNALRGVGGVKAI